MPTNHDLNRLVANLVSEHFELEEDLEQIVWLKKGSADEIRLLEINRNTAATGLAEVFGFAPSADVPYPLRIAEITPEEWKRVKNGKIPLPENWSLEDAEIFTRERVDNRSSTPSSRSAKPPLKLNVFKWEGWPADATFRREDLYGDEGR